MQLREWEDLPVEMRTEKVRRYYRILKRKRGSLIYKRTFDIVASSAMAILLLPVFAVISVLIVLDSAGGVFYRQVRVTQYGKRFRIVKFRTMTAGADRAGPQVTVGHDRRVTRVGGFLRRYRLDELPQLFNILKGEMSFIGPRPERPNIIDDYMKEMPEFALRMKVKAGLAGYAQVYGKYNTTPYDKLKLDLTYIEQYSVWLDLKLMLLTLKILIKPESTEGVEENQTTAMK